MEKPTVAPRGAASRPLFPDPGVVPPAPGYWPATLREAYASRRVVERWGDGLYALRCDLGWPTGWPAGARSLKSREALAVLAAAAPRARPAGLVTGCSVFSPQSEIVAWIAKSLGVPATVFVGPNRNWGEHLRGAYRLRAEVRALPVGWNSVVAAAARGYAATHPGWVEIPFGMGRAEAVAAARREAAAVPGDVRTVVGAAGSGISLGGILGGLAGREVVGVGVAVGRSPVGTLRRWAHGVPVTVVPPTDGYHVPCFDPGMVVGAAPKVRLHPLYEAKAWRWLATGGWNQIKGPVLYVIVGGPSEEQ